MSDHDDLPAVLRNRALIEALAAAEHERWSHWQRHLHAQCDVGSDGSLTISKELADQWSAQMNTPYPELSEKEKESDREQVYRYLPIIAAALRDDRSC